MVPASSIPRAINEAGIRLGGQKEEVSKDKAERQMLLSYREGKTSRQAEMRES